MIFFPPDVYPLRFQVHLIVGAFFSNVHGVNELSFSSPWSIMSRPEKSVVCSEGNLELIHQLTIVCF